jgi:hypothetical protein
VKIVENNQKSNENNNSQFRRGAVTYQNNYNEKKEGYQAKE